MKALQYCLSIFENLKNAFSLRLRPPHILTVELTNHLPTLILPMVSIHIPSAIFYFFYEDPVPLSLNSPESQSTLPCISQTVALLHDHLDFHTSEPTQFIVSNFPRASMYSSPFHVSVQD
jgi:hypothetical protein